MPHMSAPVIEKLCAMEVSLENSDVIALGSSFVALSALVVAVWQGWLARRHNKLSVQPLLHFNVSNLNGLFIKLQSVGLGPAVVKKVIILFNGRRYENPSRDPYPEMFSQLSNKYHYLFHMPVVGSSYLPGSKETILSLQCNNFSEENKQELSGFYHQIYFEIHYTSFYGGKTLICKNKDGA